MQHFHMIYDYIVTTYKLSEHKNERKNEKRERENGFYYGKNGKKTSPEQRHQPKQ